MTTRITVEANHGWPVRVDFIELETGRANHQRQVIVPPAAKEEFYVHSGVDLRIHEVQPNEGAEADDLDPEAA